MNYKIALIGAMDEEIEALSQDLLHRRNHETTFSDFPIVTGNLNTQDVIIARCGIGKVNAALATQYIINEFNPKAIINTGVAGGVNPKVRISDLVIGHSSLQHDVDASHFGYSPGAIPRLDTSLFLADPKLVKLANEAANDQLDSKRVHLGLIASGDQFVASAEQKQAIIKLFPETTCVEMEGAAIAQVAHLNQIPHLIIRAISDQADNTAPDDFNHYLMNIIPELNGVIMRLMELL